MGTPSTQPPSETLLLLQSKLDALTLALQKAKDLLTHPTDSSDSIRRRQNSMTHWHQAYWTAYERVEAHS